MSVIEKMLRAFPQQCAEPTASWEIFYSGSANFCTLLPQNGTSKVQVFITKVSCADIGRIPTYSVIQK